jgi:antitoxin component YwqK of YwqJK toxin-antitoxin module
MGNMNRKAWFYLIVLFVAAFFEQSGNTQDTLWNQTDSEGRKQGYWKKFYPDTSLQYIGFFCNGIPVGIFTRYYENGKIMAVMNHNKDGIHSFAELFYQNDTLAANGPYYRQAKDSIWNYYSYYTGALTFRENYVRGKKEGYSYLYHPSGTLAELQQWKDNLRTGKWIQYYEDSTLRQESEYINGDLHGRYVLYSIKGKILIEGNYISGNMDGIWSFYNDNGQLEYDLTYRNGVNLDEEEYQRRALEYMKQLEDSAGKIPEPDINNFLDR